MNHFKKTSHLSEILQSSDKEATAIFIHSNNCHASTVVKNSLKEKIDNKEISTPVYIVTVQEMPILSKNIEEITGVKHESPQIIFLNKSKVIYHESHSNIDIKKIA